jgi:hypothetical protein
MMQILKPARDFMSAGNGQSDEQVDQPGFASLLDRIQQRMDALGVSAPAEAVNAAALDIAQDVARFTLDWVEGDVGDVPETGLDA